MPEYLTPGVYIEETSFRSKPIEGVPTSTFGMAGLTRYGPVPYPADDGSPIVTRPTLVTSYTEFERAFGGLENIGSRPNYLAHAARAFFGNGGRRLYVSRVFTQTNGRIDPASFAGLDVGTPAVARWRARWPGTMGRDISVRVEFRRGRNVVVNNPALNADQLTGVQEGSLVEVLPAAAQIPKDDALPADGNVRVVMRGPGGQYGLRGPNDVFQPLPTGQQAFSIKLAVTVGAGSRVDVYNELELDETHPRSIFKVLRAKDPADEFSLVHLTKTAAATTPGVLLRELLGNGGARFLSGGGDGNIPSAAELRGKEANPDSTTEPATGLAALGEIDDIAIVAMPDAATLADNERTVAVSDLIEHCERLRYRMAIVDPPDESSISGVRAFRARFDTKYAALYYPWLEIVDPTVRPEPGASSVIIRVPPSGAVAGIYARSDAERGVHKAPANEVVLGITQFAKNVTYGQQSVLNPEGVNALRFFEGRSNRVWGARTMTSDPEWKYVNIRRLFIYIEHSIDKATQWAVFEPNNERLWSSIRQSIEDFLLVAWRDGALMGTRPEQAFFVRCDRTTMTQNDLDNGRLICLIGVAPTYPAEFVIFRVGQWTADARRG